jgi:hypothetical protein
VLACDDVLDVKQKRRVVLLMNPAILAALTGALTNEHSEIGRDSAH